MRFEPGWSGNPAGRPPRSAELRAVLRHNAASIAKLLPNARLTGYALLHSIYTDERMPLLLRMQAATAVLPIENSGLACAEVLDGMRRDQLAAKAAPTPPPVKRPRGRPRRATTAPAAPPTPEVLRAEDYIE